MGLTIAQRAAVKACSDEHHQFDTTTAAFRGHGTGCLIACLSQVPAVQRACASQYGPPAEGGWFRAAWRLLPSTCMSHAFRERLAAEFGVSFIKIDLTHLRSLADPDIPAFALVESKSGPKHHFVIKLPGGTWYDPFGCPEHEHNSLEELERSVRWFKGHRAWIIRA